MFLNRFLLFVFTTLISMALNAQDLERLKDANNKMSEEKYAEALKIYEELLALDSNDAIGRAWLYGYAGMCNENLGNQEKAISCYKSAITNKFPEMAIYNKLHNLAKKNRDYELQEFTLKAKLDMFPGTSATTLKSLCYVYANLKKYDDLFETANIMSKLESNNYIYPYFKGLAKQQTGDIQSAIGSYKEAVQINPTDYSANRNLGLLMYNRVSAKYEQENKKYKALKAPSRVDYHNYNKAIEVLEQQYLEAEPFLKAAYSSKPDDALRKALYNLYIRTKRKDTAESYR